MRLDVAAGTPIPPTGQSRRRGPRVHRILIEPSALAMPSALEATLRGKFLGPFVKLGPAVLVVDARPFARGEQPAPGDVSWLAPAVAEVSSLAFRRREEKHVSKEARRFASMRMHSQLTRLLALQVGQVRPDCGRHARERGRSGTGGAAAARLGRCAAR